MSETITPKFSIIIPTFNRAEFIENAIQSILNQTYNNYEIIIIDDGSTDNTENIISKFLSEKVKYIQQENAERGAARNRGLREANGDYVNFLDSDDLLYPHHLEVAKNLINRLDKPEIFHLNYEIKNIKLNTLKSGPILNQTANKLLIQGNFLSCNGVFIRRDISLANPFNEIRILAAMEDWELWLRLSSQYPIYYENKITSVIIDHDYRSVASKNTVQLITRVNSLLNNILGNTTLVKYYKKDLRKFKSSCYTYIALHISLSKTNRLKTVRYALKGFVENPYSIFTRRSLAILKHFI